VSLPGSFAGKPARRQQAQQAQQTQQTQQTQHAACTAGPACSRPSRIQCTHWRQFPGRQLRQRRCHWGWWGRRQARSQSQPASHEAGGQVDTRGGPSFPGKQARLPACLWLPLRAAAGSAQAALQAAETHPDGLRQALVWRHHHPALGAHAHCRPGRQAGGQGRAGRQAGRHWHRHGKPLVSVAWNPCPG
jgi:hypothetical protein